MCYTYSTVRQVAEKLIARGLIKPEALRQFADLYFVSGFEHPNLPVITATDTRPMQWGLVPSWVRTQQQANELRVHTLNARSETLFEKASYREAVRHRRCLVAASGFYEWYTEGKNKYPYYIAPSDNSFFLFAAIYETWRNPDTGHLLESFALVTTEANQLMGRIHNTKRRMPLIFNESQAQLWLQSPQSPHELQQLMQPAPVESLSAHSVRKFRPSDGAKLQTPELQVYFPYPELAHVLTGEGHGGMRSLFDDLPE